MIKSGLSNTITLLTCFFSPRTLLARIQFLHVCLVLSRPAGLNVLLKFSLAIPRLSDKVNTSQTRKKWNHTTFNQFNISQQLLLSSRLCQISTDQIWSYLSVLVSQCQSLTVSKFYFQPNWDRWLVVSSCDILALSWFNLWIPHFLRYLSWWNKTLATPLKFCCSVQAAI